MKRREIKRTAWISRGTKELTRAPLARGTSRLPRVAIQRINAARVARKHKAYGQRLAKADWKALRRQAYDRDGGLCWCPTCVTGRANGEAFAFEPIPVWFDRRGGIHGFHTHHTTYVRFGHEDLADLLTMHPTHHQALESQKGYRAQFLRTGK